MGRLEGEHTLRSLEKGIACTDAQRWKRPSLLILFHKLYLALLGHWPLIQRTVPYWALPACVCPFWELSRAPLWHESLFLVRLGLAKELYQSDADS